MRGGSRRAEGEKVREEKRKKESKKTIQRPYSVRRWDTPTSTRRESGGGGETWKGNC